MIINKSKLSSIKELREVFKVIENQYARFFMVGGISIFKTWRYHAVSNIDKKNQNDEKISIIRLLLSAFKYLIHCNRKQKISNRNYKINKKTHIIFIVQTISHLKSLKPLISYISKQKEMNYLIICDTDVNIKAFIKKNNINHINSNHFPISIRKVMLFQFKIIYNILRFIKDLNEGLIDENIKMSSWLFLKNKAIITAHKLFFINEVLKKIKPSCLFIFNQDLSLSQIANQVAKKMNIKTFYLQHGNIGLFNPFYSSIDSDIAIVSGENDKGIIKELGCKSKFIFKAGRPIFDEIYSLKIKNQKLKIEQIKNGNPIITFFPNRISGLLKKSLNMINYIEVLETAKCMPDMNFVIKFHPNEALIERSNIIKEYNENNNIIILHKEYESTDILTATDVCITMFSTTGFEAILLDKPLIIMNIDFPEFIDEAIFKGASINLVKKNKLAGIIRDILNSKYKKLLSEGRAKVIEKSVYKFDGKSSERVFELIKNSI